MKVAIMQPYFFPYIGQFQLIQATDRFILCDDVQFMRHGWIARNRILGHGEEPQYIIVPVAAHKTRTPIKDIQVVPGEGWKQTILKQLDRYRKKAPYYEVVRKLVCDCLTPAETSITRLNGRCLQAVCNYIGIDFTIEISSELHLDYSNVQETGDWAVQMCTQLGASEYYNPPGGTALYDKDVFSRHNIGLSFVKPHLMPYDQCNHAFIPGLSVIDIMMFNPPAAIKEMLNDYQLL